MFLFHKTFLELFYTVFMSSSKNTKYTFKSYVSVIIVKIVIKW